jgi:hypothetical protein
LNDPAIWNVFFPLGARLAFVWVHETTVKNHLFAGVAAEEDTIATVVRRTTAKTRVVTADIGTSSIAG